MSARFNFLRVSEGEALNFFFFKGSQSSSCTSRRNQNVPEFQIPHAKMCPEIRENKQTNFGNLNVEVNDAEKFLS